MTHMQPCSTVYVHNYALQQLHNRQIIIYIMVLSKVHRSDCWTVYLYARESPSNVQLLYFFKYSFKGMKRGRQKAY